jgi:hypothetical protein
MTRARHVTPGQTAARIERLRMLITTLQVRQLLRDELGDILKVGPSGVRKYLKDLRGKVELTIDAGNMVCRLVMSAEESRVYLATLATQIPVRQAAAPRSAFRHAAQDPARHFHILADDTHYAIRVSRAPIVRDPWVAALFGAGPARMEVRA